jgi:hypothetical protein
MTYMRFALLFAAQLLLVRCSASTTELAPLQWQRVAGPGPNGAVLGFGAPGSFDERGNFTITAFKDGDLFRLYYGGADATGSCPGINGAHWRIGLATSTDGLNWTRVPGSATGGAILDNGTAGHFDTFLTYRPYVLKDGSVYRMWYNGSTEAFNCPSGTLAENRRIGYAESTDGVSFTRMNDGPGPDGTVLPLGPAGSIDEQQVGYVWVIKDTSDYKMYYSANDAHLFWRVGLAVSTDGHHFTKVPGKLAGGAILDVGPAGSFDVACAYQPSVVKERDQLYRMWYRGCQAPGAQGGPSLGVIGYAESNDGVTWVKISQPTPTGAALAQGPAGNFDSVGLTTPSVFLDGTTWNMYYAGFDKNGVFLTGLARAPNP